MSANLPDVPSRLLTDVEARLAAARENDELAWQEILAENRVRETLPRVWACSEFVATACLRAPQLLRELSASGALFERAADDAIAREGRERVTRTHEDTRLQV